MARTAQDEKADLRAAGDRIEAVLAELRSSLDSRTWALVEEAIGLVTDLYGGGLERVLALVSDDAVDRLVADDLVASLLILHDLHPLDLADRVDAALESVRPDLASCGSQVEVVSLDEPGGSLRLRLSGRVNGNRPAATLMREAVAATAPEIVHLDVIDDTSTPTLVTLSSTRVRTG